MKNTMSLLRHSVTTTLTILCSAILFTSCLKDKNDDNANIPAAGLMAFNLAPDQQGLVVQLSGNTLTPAPLTYTSYNGGYQNIFAGSRTVESYSYPSSTPLVSSSFVAAPDQYYTLFFVGSKGSYRNLIATDALDSLPVVEKAYVRYVNAVTDTLNTATVNVTAGAANIISDNAVYGNVSQFAEVSPGSITVTVKSANGVDANRTFNVEAKKVYTLLLVGVPGTTEENQKVQIRYIENGTLTNDKPNQ